MLDKIVDQIFQKFGLVVMQQATLDDLHERLRVQTTRADTNRSQAKHRAAFLETELRRAIRPEITRRFEELQKRTS